MIDGTPGPGQDPGQDYDRPEPPRLRQLRWMVNALTLALIAGVLVIAATLVIRLSAGPSLPLLPEAVTVPAGETARAVTFGQGWIAVVTADAEGVERIRVLDAASGAPRGDLVILPE